MQQLPDIVVCLQGVSLVIFKAKEWHFSCKCLIKESCIAVLDMYHSLVFNPQLNL